MVRLICCLLPFFTPRGLASASGAPEIKAFVASWAFFGFGLVIAMAVILNTIYGLF
jgi:hypothetical protein